MTDGAEGPAADGPPRPNATHRLDGRKYFGSLKFFITLVTAVLAGLATLLKTGEGWELKYETLPVTMFALLGLLVIGVVIFFRIIQRNRVTDGYKRAMDEIRNIFKEKYDEKGVLENYFPFSNSLTSIPIRIFLLCYFQSIKLHGIAEILPCY